MSAILQTEHLGVSFNRFAAVRDVTLAVRRNTVHSVIGPNGAGKTTLFNLLGGKVRPTRGRVFFDGRDVTYVPANRRVVHGVARSFQVTNLFQTLSVRENLRVAAQGTRSAAALAFWKPASRLRGAAETAEAILHRLRLHDVATAAAGTLSHGDQRVLEVGMCLAASPKLLLLDEPTSGMGVDDLPRMRELIRDLAVDHTVLLVEHNMSIVMAISDTVTVMFQGAVLREGTPAEIRADPEVRRVYLGSAALPARSKNDGRPSRDGKVSGC